MGYINDDVELFPSSGHSRVSRLDSIYFYLLEILKDSKVALIPFSYPFARTFIILSAFLSTFNSCTHDLYKNFSQLLFYICDDNNNSTTCQVEDYFIFFF